VGFITLLADDASHIGTIGNNAVHGRGLLSMEPTVLFDLGGTLAQYFERAEFPHVLAQAITGVQHVLCQEGLLRVSSEDVWRMVREEDHEAPDHRVRRLEGRLVRIFGLDDALLAGDLMMAMCRAFMRPIYARGRRYEDTYPVLHRLRSEGFRMAIVSNTPWGSPSLLWREEIDRLGLREWMDAVIFCVDVGWRKPARQIFDAALEALRARPEECLFVGDDPRWDLVGPKAVGIEAILIDRWGVRQKAGEETVRSLGELAHRLAPGQHDERDARH
jgi:putative hydrolase of the HAD superfamily